MSTIIASNLGGPSSTGTAATLSSINSGQISGMRNRVINGAMTVDQRNNGAAQVVTAGVVTYTVDRWFLFTAGANMTGQRVVGATAGQYRYRVTGAAGVTGFTFGQRIESINSADLAGTTVTISADIANSLLGTVGWQLQYATATDNFNALTSIASGSWSVTSTVTRYSVQIAVPAGAVTGLQLVFNIGAQTSGTFTIGNIQLESGAVATPFERRSHGLELALCQRYYHETSNVNDYYGRAGSNLATTYHVITHHFPVQMRAAPTFSAAAATFQAANASILSNNTTPNRHVSLMSLSNTANLDCYFLLATGKLTWSIEL